MYVTPSGLRLMKAKIKKKKVKKPKVTAEEKYEIDLEDLRENRNLLKNAIYDFAQKNSRQYKILPGLFEGYYIAVLKCYTIDVREKIVMPPTSFQGDAMDGKDIYVYKYHLNQDYARLIILDYAINREVKYLNSDDSDSWDDVVADYMPNFFKGGCRLCKIQSVYDIASALEYA